MFVGDEGHGGDEGGSDEGGVHVRRAGATRCWYRESPDEYEPPFIMKGTSAGAGEDEKAKSAAEGYRGEEEVVEKPSEDGYWKDGSN